jgi:hypothetical protein
VEQRAVKIGSTSLRSDTALAASAAGVTPGEVLLLHALPRRSVTSTRRTRVVLRGVVIEMERS